MLCRSHRQFVRLKAATAYADPAHPALAGRRPAELASWLQRCSETAPQEVFKEERRDRVGRVAVDGAQWVVKSQHRRGLEAYRRRWGGGALWREWRQSGRLTAAGIAASRPVALIERGESCGRRQTLVLPFVDGVSLCHLLMGFELPAAWRDLSRRERRRLAWMIGDQVGAIAAAGLVNRDHKPANLILTPSCLTSARAAGRPLATPVVIDPVGLRTRRSSQQVIRMLAVLYRTALRAGPASPTELLTCLAAAARRDPSLAPRDMPGGKRTSLRNLARSVEAAAELESPSSPQPADGRACM